VIAEPIEQDGRRAARMTHGLVFATFRSNFPAAMSRLSARQILNLILAILVTAGLSLSVTSAADL
jgi:hypothetical protein